MDEKSPLTKIIENLIPFIVAGVAIALCLALLFMFSYVLLWGIVIGGVLWLVATIKQYLFPGTASNTEAIKKNHSRIIEHDDKK